MRSTILLRVFERKAMGQIHVDIFWRRPVRLIHPANVDTKIVSERVFRAMLSSCLNIPRRGRSKLMQVDIIHLPTMGTTSPTFYMII